MHYSALIITALHSYSIIINKDNFDINKSIALKLQNVSKQYQRGIAKCNSSVQCT